MVRGLSYFLLVLFCYFSSLQVVAKDSSVDKIGTTILSTSNVELSNIQIPQLFDYGKSLDNLLDIRLDFYTKNSVLDSNIELYSSHIVKDWNQEIKPSCFLSEHIAYMFNSFW